jgi:hypothetical protein
MFQSRQRVPAHTPINGSVRTVIWTLLVTAVAALGGVWSGGAIGQVNPTTPGSSTMRPLDPAHPQTYREVLVFGLKARLPSELAFVDSVVVAVEEGRLPARLVDQTYFWARTRSGNSLYGRPNRPIVYFIPALEARVKKLHLNVELVGGLP